MDTSNMTADQLRQLQRDLYKAAGDDGTLRLLRLVAEELGEPVPAKYGPKWQWSSGDVEIYRDDYGGYTTVSAAGRLVCSTHNNAQLFVPGPWVETIKHFAKQALQAKQGRAGELEARQRVELLERLGLSAVPQEPLPVDDVIEEEPDV